MKKYNLKYSSGIKSIAIILLFITVFISVAGGLGSIAMWRSDVYKSSKESMKEEIYEQSTYYEGANAVLMYLNGGYSDSLYNYGTYENVEIEIVSGLEPFKTAGVDEKENLIAYEQTYYLREFYSSSNATNISDEALDSELESIILDITSSAFISTELSEEFNMHAIEVIVYVDEDYPVIDAFYFDVKVLEVVYALKEIIVPAVILSMILSLALFWFLAHSLGYRKEEEYAVACGTARIPYELVGLVFICTATPCFIEGADAYTYGVANAQSIYIICGAAVLGVMACICVWFCLDFSVRWKTRTLWSNTVVVRIWRKLEPIRRGKQLGRFVFKMSKKLGNAIPIMWKGLVIYGVISLWGFVIVFSWGEYVRLVMWLMVNVVAFPVLAYTYYMFSKLRKALKAVGDGDLNYKVHKDLWVMEFQEMGNSLNAIGDGMEAALKEKMKSEHMKTELISNVSHDIKTPLTSIINYADLISKEETDNVKIHEYSEILLRQSDRLKRLTEDLVHASKVTSGNVEVKLAPCNIGVLLNQAIGEYEEKLSQVNLRVVLKEPKEAVILEADGRHLWRVFDNLFNNIYKYAQEGTRVYLTLKQENQKIEIEFKNISKYELDITEEELMERFVRGDKSRHSEGNGLGLSIAKSLVEVQGGSMKLAIDGDLFKVMIVF